MVYSQQIKVNPLPPLGGLLLSLAVGGVFSLSVYTILFLKLYSYRDVNRWSREIRHAKARTLSRSQSCESCFCLCLGAYHTHHYVQSTERFSVFVPHPVLKPRAVLMAATLSIKVCYFVLLFVLLLLSCLV